LEDAGEAEAGGDVAAQALDVAVVHEPQVGAVAGAGGIGADLPADEGGEDLAAGRGEAVERPDGVVVAGDVFLEGELRGERAHERVVARFAAALEDARLAGAAEEPVVDVGVVPG